MGMSKASALDLIVYVDPVRYYEMPYKEKNSVARLIGAVNWHYRDLRKHMMLIVPGRVGTTSPNWACPRRFRISAPLKSSVKRRSERQATIRSCPTGAISSRIWWRPKSFIPPCSAIRRPSGLRRRSSKAVRISSADLSMGKSSRRSCMSMMSAPEDAKCIMTWPANIC